MDEENYNAELEEIQAVLRKHDRMLLNIFVWNEIKNKFESLYTRHVFNMDRRNDLAAIVDYLKQSVRQQEDAYAAEFNRPPDLKDAQRLYDNDRGDLTEARGKPGDTDHNVDES